MNVDGKEETPRKKMLDYLSELAEESLNSDLECNIEIRVLKDYFALGTTFFKDGNNFTINVYDFHSVEVNNGIIETVKSLIEDGSKFEEMYLDNHHYTGV